MKNTSYFVEETVEVKVDQIISSAVKCYGLFLDILFSLSTKIDISWKIPKFNNRKELSWA